jgi:para-aminobenzoate synthetase component 1
MKLVYEFSWHNPLNITEYLQRDEQYLALLYSANHYSYSGNHSFLAWGLDTEIKNDLSQLKKVISDKKDFWSNFYLGYIGYESLVKQDNYKNIDNSYFFKPKNLIIFNHQHKTCKLFSNLTAKNLEFTINKIKKIITNKQIVIDDNIILENVNWQSNMTKKSYITKVKRIIQNIVNGDYYQVNLTRKFFTNISLKNKFTIFRNLVKHSPTPYMAYFKLLNTEILSSSPERFIKIEPDGKINTRPIKGTSNRTRNNDKQITKLRNSSKDQAENLMIVDLMRHDLSASAQYNSVKVAKLFAIDSFATLNHMSSSINALKKKSLSNLEVVTTAFPPASMTGAPKIAAMQSINQLENASRGIYSGCLGYFAGNGYSDLSVVIRTIIIKDNYLEFQVGGGIIYDSKPEAEWRETLIKAQGICKALNININNLATL